MKKLLLLLTPLLFVGCATKPNTNQMADTLAVPKGNWVRINKKGYIPPNTDIYTIDDYGNIYYLKNSDDITNKKGYTSIQNPVFELDPKGGLTLVGKAKHTNIAPGSVDKGEKEINNKPVVETNELINSLSEESTGQSFENKNSPQLKPFIPNTSLENPTETEAIWRNQNESQQPSIF